MNAPDDSELLRRYIAERSEAAFGELVRRHVARVYAVALRQVGGDAHLAQDVTQMVFTAVARKAGQLAERPALGGWLFRTTHFAARDVVRSERRRRAREQEALAMDEHSGGDQTATDWEKLRPTLDELLNRLGEADRAAVWLRFFEGRAFVEIGATLRLTENAARMRVERALDKLHRELARRGVTSTTSALGIALTQQAIAVVPAGLPAAITGAAIASAGVGGGGAATAIATLCFMSKVKVAVVVIVLGSAAGVAVREVWANRELSSEVSRLRASAAHGAAVREETARLSTAVAAQTAGKPEASELVQLRERIARLKARPDGVVDEEMKPLAAFGNAGWGTATAAYETQLWARATQQWDEFAKAFGWTEKGKARLDVFFAGLPESVRARHGTPEKLLAPMASAWGKHGAPVAVQILGETDHGLKVMVHAWARYASGHEAKLDMLFQRFEDGWRVPHPDEMVNGIIASLDPATGEKMPKNN